MAASPRKRLFLRLARETVPVVAERERRVKMAAARHDADMAERRRDFDARLAEYQRARFAELGPEERARVGEATNVGLRSDDSSEAARLRAMAASIACSVPRPANCKWCARLEPKELEHPYYYCDICMCGLCAEDKWSCACEEA